MHEYWFSSIKMVSESLENKPELVFYDFKVQNHVQTSHEHITWIS